MVASIANWAAGGDVGDEASSWDGGRNSCVRMGLYDPDPVLVAAVPATLEFTINSATSSVGDAINRVKDGIASLTGSSEVELAEGETLEEVTRRRRDHHADGEYPRYVLLAFDCVVCRCCSFSSFTR